MRVCFLFENGNLGSTQAFAAKHDVGKRAEASNMSLNRSRGFLLQATPSTKTVDQNIFYDLFNKEIPRLLTCPDMH